MAGGLLLPPWAVHISDGVLTAPWLAGGFAVAALLACLGAWRIRDEEIPRVALLTAAFFVASLIHVRVGPTSVHLLLNGLVGVVLGWRAALSIPVGLFLQAALLQHGGFTSLGVNSCVMVLPALLAWQLFALVRRVPWVRRPWFRSALVAFGTLAWVLSLVFSVALLLTNWGHSLKDLDFGPAEALAFHPAVLLGALTLAVAVAGLERRLENAPEFPVGLLVGEVAALATILLNCVALVGGGQEDWQTLALIVFVAHLPVAVVEGVVLGFTVGFLAQVKPELLGWEPRGADSEAEGDPATPGEAPAGKAVSKALGGLLLIAFGLLAPAAEARAHALMAECEVLPGRRVRVNSWYSARPKSFPAREARVRVYGPGNRLLVEGQTDEQGSYEFHYEKYEALTVEVYQLGHRQTVTLPASALQAVPGSPPDTESGTERPPRAKTGPSVVVSSAGEHSQEWVKDVLVGVAFLLALAAFVLSVRNARQLRSLRPPPGGPDKPA